ncbi:helix-turn-helix transcriptional regulator [Actinomadura macra]|uniref:helix-turn-helix transcriptional regulator n=1 Tax=Actinomadura macra TaxID=46164 RepID=UPI00082C0AC7|nr:LuxR family transcriptional regulator [Actinomadura macra]
MNLVERDEELAALEELLAGFAQARSTVVLMSGGIATGKTALLRTFAEKAAGSGALYLGAVASRLERNVPFGVLEQLFRSPDLPDVSAEAAMRWLDAGVRNASPDGTASVGDTGRLSSPILRGLCDVLRDLTDSRPVVIGVDDAHYADETSLGCLFYLLRRLRSAPLHLIFSECSHLAAANALLHTEVLRDPSLCRIRLEPLSKAGVTDMIAARLGEEDARDLAPSFHEASVGYPPLVQALIEDYRADPEIMAAGLTGGDAFGRAVLNLLYRYEAPVMEVARATAILGDHASVKLLGRILDIDAGSVAQSLNTLTSAGIWANGRFRHDAFPAAILDGTPPTARMVTHGRAAELLNNEGVAAAEVAAHIVAADHIDAPWVIPILREAAEHALANDNVITSLHYLRAAHQMCDDERQRPVIASALADAEWRVDPARVLRHLHEINPVANGHPMDGMDGYDGFTPVTYLLWHGRMAEALDIVDTSPHDREGVPPAADLETPRLWAAYLYPALLRDHFAVHPGPTAHGRGWKAAPNPELQGAAMLASGLVHGSGNGILDTAEGILQRSRLNHRTFAPLTTALALLIYNDRLDQAATWCDSLLEEAAARSSPTWHALFSAERALISVRRGDLVAAQRHADFALRLIPPASWGVAVGLPLAAMVQATTSLGDVDGAATYLDVPVREAMFQTRMGLHYLCARGRHHLEAGRPHAALSDFRACGKLMAGWGIDLPAVEPWRAGAAQAHLLLGEELEARRLIDGQLALLSPAHLRTRGISLRVQAATRDIEARPPLLREAVAVLERSGDQLELAYALADLSRACKERGEGRDARALARRACDLAHRCGIDLADRVLAGELAEPDGEPGRVAELSDAEQRVAALAAEGCTNREISERLYITISTVEQHLTKIYRKLNVKRFDLRSALQHHETNDAVSGIPRHGGQVRLVGDEPRPQPAANRNLWPAGQSVAACNGCG